ncbi:MAG TPA: Fic family protein [Candidatus Sulfotelmatobacter sp.]|jgi:Fic family protein
MTEAEVNIHILDAAYKPFPAFAEWAARTSVDNVRWERYNSSLKGSEGLTPEILSRARQIAQRAAALDTGAIEGLYEVDRGFTYTVAFQTSAWEAALAAKGENVRSLFEAQLHAYDYVLDLATSAQPISEAAIRALHEEVCRAQPTYRVITAIGPQEHPLPKGQYKTLPNHVRTRKGTDHSYAPVDVTPAEMARLVGELRSDTFMGSHPVLQAAYAHYGLVVVHPFADGNGRVARALASAFTYRAIRMPIVILSEQKNIYLDVLESADSGNYQAFVDFMLARSLDTIELVSESVRAALVPSSDRSLSEIKNLYLTKGGYTHDQVDEAGKALLGALKTEIQTAMSKNAAPKVSFSQNLHNAGYVVSDPAYRSPLTSGLQLTVSLSSAAPAQANVMKIYHLWLPKDAAGEDDILIKNASSVERFAARLDEILPSLSGVLQMRIKIFAERVVGEMLNELTVAAKTALQKPH